jgi:hypothetical protein
MPNLAVRDRLSLILRKSRVKLVDGSKSGRSCLES